MTSRSRGESGRPAESEEVDRAVPRARAPRKTDSPGLSQTSRGNGREIRARPFVSLRRLRRTEASERDIRVVPSPRWPPAAAKEKLPVSRRPSLVGSASTDVRERGSGEILGEATRQSQRLIIISPFGEVKIHACGNERVRGKEEKREEGASGRGKG